MECKVQKLNCSWIVIPAYNEGLVIADVLSIVTKYFANRIVVVDDCSTDNTVDVAKEYGNVVSHPINLGQGAAIQTGVDFAIQNGAEIVVTFDSDGQHRIEDAITMIDKLSLDEPMIVCGSRFLGIAPENISLRKRFALKLATYFTRIVTGVNVTDAHNGLRAINKLALKKLRIEQNRMAHATEIISKVRDNKIKYIEVPVKIIYTDYSVAKGQKLSNIINIVLDLFIGGVSK